MYVVSHLYKDCSPADAERSTSTGADPTYAELAKYPKASIPSSFTICSMVMVPQCSTQGNSQFFALLDEDGENFISAILHHSWTSYRLNVRGNPYIPPGAPSSTVFPEQWLKSCLAVQTETGHLQWVVDGQVVEYGIFEEIKKSADKND